MVKQTGMKLGKEYLEVPDDGSCTQYLRDAIADQNKRWWRTQYRLTISDQITIGHNSMAGNWGGEEGTGTGGWASSADCSKRQKEGWHC